MRIISGLATLAAFIVLRGSAADRPIVPVFHSTGIVAQVLPRVAKAKAAEHARPATRCGETLNMGFHIQRFSTGLRAAIWYPTTAAEAPYEYPGAMESSVAVDSPVAPCGRYPLIVFSHGYGGCSIQSVFFTEALTRAGYIVVAPDHKDAMCKADQRIKLSLLDTADFPSKQKNYSDASYRDRQQDIKTALDEVLRDPQFGRWIDANRIGGAGHSLGGYTILGMAGAWSSWKDNRIKAGLLLSPFLRPYLENGGIRAVHIPLMYQGGTRDSNITPYVEKPGGAYDQSNSPKYFVDLKGAGHLDWSNLTCLFRKYVSACADEAEKPRLINAYGIAFLNRYLKSQVAPILDSPNRELASLRHAN